MKIRRPYINMYVGLAAWVWKWNVFTLVNKISEPTGETQPMELCLFPYKSLRDIFYSAV